ncbi:hypothetical protein [Streptomyces decoyicus]|uniref:hypothetical protein n=1 Tax=Streptomyces decoyicus TaxID=249567 RepID=UPI0033A82742
MITNHPAALSQPPSHTRPRKIRRIPCQVWCAPRSRSFAISLSTQAWAVAGHYVADEYATREGFGAGGGSIPV